MSDEALRRTIRRSAAFLSIPLWLIVMQLHFLSAEFVFDGLPAALTLYLPGLMLAGSFAYLVVWLRTGSDVLEEFARSDGS